LVILDASIDEKPLLMLKCFLSPPQTESELLKFYQIFVLDKDLEQGSSRIACPVLAGSFLSH
jgi:hypothetical protein